VRAALGRSRGQAFIRGLEDHAWDRLTPDARANERFDAVYAIVRAGGRQEKVAVDDVLTVNRLAGEVGDEVTFPAVLVVDGDSVVTAPAELAKYKVTAEILGAAKGPKINIMHYRNKTGYKRRMGHRQPLTEVKVTGIKAGK
jgi:large subunit ribosomal protein L21